MADKDLSPEELNAQSPDANEEVALDSEGLLDENGGLAEDSLEPPTPSAPAGKVELDLDDAPFLEEPEQAVEEAKPEDKAEDKLDMVPAEQEKLSFKDKIKKLLKNKKIVAGAGGGLIIVIALLVFLLSGGEEEQEQPQNATATTESQPKLSEEDLPPIEAKPGEELIAWEPFWIEYIDTDGVTRFLVCQFSAPTTDPGLKQEADAKALLLRDAIYYYLTHKPMTFLSDQRNAESLKEDILGIINGNLSRGELTELYIESYIIK